MVGASAHGLRLLIRPWVCAVNTLLPQEVALSDNRQHLDELPARARETLLSVVAAYIPYYNPPHVISRGTPPASRPPCAKLTPASLLAAFWSCWLLPLLLCQCAVLWQHYQRHTHPLISCNWRFLLAPLSLLQLAKRVLEDFPSPYHTLTEGGHTPGEGADFLLGEVTDTVTRVRTEQGLLTYLSCLKALGGAPHLKSLKAITRLRLQSELYSLTSPGGRGGVPAERGWGCCWDTVPRVHRSENAAVVGPGGGGDTVCAGAPSAESRCVVEPRGACG